jgi:hypothetical protein
MGLFGLMFSGLMGQLLVLIVPRQEDIANIKDCHGDSEPAVGGDFAKHMIIKAFLEPLVNWRPWHTLKEGNAMNFEERIDRLTDRHEALTQSVEMMQRDLDTMKGIAQTALDSINALARIAERHERRITHIDGGDA